MACLDCQNRKPTRLPTRDMFEIALLLTIACLLVWARVAMFDGPAEDFWGWLLGNVGCAVPTFIAGCIFANGFKHHQ